MRKRIDHFGQLSAWDFTAEHLNAMVEALEEADYKPSTINREVTDIRSAYSG